MLGRSVRVGGVFCHVLARKPLLRNFSPPSGGINPSLQLPTALEDIQPHVNPPWQSSVPAWGSVGGSPGSADTYSALLEEHGERGNYSLSAAVTHRFDVSGAYGAQERQLLLQYNGLASDHLALVNNTLAAAESLYWQSFIARQNILLQRGILNQRKEDLRITEEKFRQQLIPRLDVVRAQAKVEEAESLVVEAESVYKNTLAGMRTLAGGVDLEPQEENLLVPSLSVEVGMKEAVERRNDVRSAETALERAKVLKPSARGSPHPVEGSVGYMFLGQCPEPIHRKGFSLSLNVPSPLYDGGTRRRMWPPQDNRRGAEWDGARKSQVRRLWGMPHSREKAVGGKPQEKAVAVRTRSSRSPVMYKEGMGAQIDLCLQVTPRKSSGTLAAIKECTSLWRVKRV